MLFSRALLLGQVLVLWAVAALIILEVMYPSTTLLYWSNGWLQMPNPFLREWKPHDDWVEVGGVRKLIVTLTQGQQIDAYGRADFKESPDFHRMAAEVVMTVLIGGALVYAAGHRRNRVTRISCRVCRL